MCLLVISIVYHTIPNRIGRVHGHNCNKRDGIGNNREKNPHGQYHDNVAHHSLVLLLFRRGMKSILDLGCYPTSDGIRKGVYYGAPAERRHPLQTAILCHNLHWNLGQKE